MTLVKYILFLYLIPVLSIAQINPNRIPLSTLDFLLYPSDAISASLGMGGFSQLSSQSNWHDNPSKTAFLKENFGIGFSYNPVLFGIVSDMKLAQIQSYKRLDRSGVINLGFTYFNGGMIDLRDDFANSIGTFSPHQLALNCGYTIRFNKSLSGGVGLRYVNAQIAPNKKFGEFSIHTLNTLNGDMSIFFQENSDKIKYFSAAAMIQNIGAKVNWGDVSNLNFQPTIFRVGGAFHLKRQLNQLSFNLDLHKMLTPTPPMTDSDGKILRGFDHTKKSALAAIFSSWIDAPDGLKEELREIMTSIGSEFNFQNKASGRVGFFNDLKGKRQLISTGVGLNNLLKNESKWRVGLDATFLFSLKSHSPLSNTYFVTFNISRNNI